MTGLSRRVWSIALLIFWPLFGLHMSSRASPALSAPATGITFMVFGDLAELRAYQNLVRAFEQEEERVDVEIIHIPSQNDYRRRLAADFAAGIPADVILINYRRYAGFAARGALEPLGSYLAGSTVIKVSDFYSQAVAPFRWRGGILCVPQNLSSLVVYYNKRLFDAARMPYPKDSWTWNEFLSTAKALTRDTNGDGRVDQFGLGTEATLFRVAPFIWQNGGDIVDDEQNPQRLTLDSPAAMEAIQWFVDLQVKHHVVPSATEEQAEDSESRFLNGRTAMFLNSRRGVPTYRGIKSFDWDVAALPRHKRPAGILHADAYCMPSSAKNKRAIWKFIEFANSLRGQTVVAVSGRTVPSLRAVANSPAFLDPRARPRNSRVFLDTIPFIRPVPIHRNWVDVENLAGEEIERAFYGHASVAEAVKSAVARTTPAFSR